MKYIVLLIIFLGGLHSLSAQAPVYQILGPHQEYNGPYHVRVFINYYQPYNNLWATGIDLTSRTEGIIENLNNIYNPYDIYFMVPKVPAKSNIR